MVTPTFSTFLHNTHGGCTHFELHFFDLEGTEETIITKLFKTSLLDLTSPYTM